MDVENHLEGIISDLNNELEDCTSEITRLRAALDAPPTPAEAMERCPEVAALVKFAQGLLSERDRDDDWRIECRAALAPFTKGSDE